MELYLRKATKDDMDILFQWANDEIVRKNSFNSEMIPYEVHQKWFLNVLEDSHMVQYILEGADENNNIIQIGQIRFNYNIHEQSAVVDYSIDAKYRGLGYGKQIIRLGTNSIKAEFLELQKIVAKVKPTNIASYKAFTDNGYSEKYIELALDCREEKIVSHNETNVCGGVIFLTNNKNSLGLYYWLEKKTSVIVFSDPISIEDINRLKPNLIVSYNYMHIVPDEVIRVMKKKIINMHISYLPWNRGANPNFWSFIDDTPKGVTIHLLNEGLDKGDILFQKEIWIDDNESFSATYDKLHTEIVNLFKAHWDEIIAWNVTPKKQVGQGSYHSIRDFRSVKEKMDFSWDDQIADVVKKYKELFI